jgi:protein involved in polysaccharide export with SLBB domain
MIILQSAPRTRAEAGEIMPTGQARSSWWSRWQLGAVLALLAGCGTDQARLSRALLADRNPAAHGGEVDRHYQVHCPDVLTVAVEGVTPAAVSVPVAADGRMALAEGGFIRVDGLSTPEIAHAVAQHYGVGPGQVEIRVAGYNSQQLFLYGQVSGGEHAIAYQGPETVLDVLQRVGGLTPGALAEDVQVIRSHVADGKPPEVFHVDLAAIVNRHDPQTNVTLEPFDQIYIGQSRRSKLCPCLPPWLRPLYEALSGMTRR